jgi:hypothetical protein
MSKFMLYCGVEGSYTLTKEGEEEGRVFPSMHKALECARSLATSETPIIVYSPTGKEIIRSTIWPFVAEARVGRNGGRSDEVKRA